MVRWGAGSGRLRAAAVVNTLAHSLQALHDDGWPCSWALLPRRANAEAHQAARAAGRWASRRGSGGRRVPGPGWPAVALPACTPSGAAW